MSFGWRAWHFVEQDVESCTDKEVFFYEGLARRPCVSGLGINLSSIGGLGVQDIR